MNKGFDLSSFDAFRKDVEKEARKHNLICFTPMTEADLAAEYTVARLKTEPKERITFSVMND